MRTRGSRIRRAAMALVGLLLTLGAGLVLVAPPASACSCAPRTTAEQVDAADLVVSGTVRDLRKGTDGTDATAGLVTMGVDVGQVHKGDPGSGRLEVSTAISSAACGLGPLPAGERYVFFLTADGEQLRASSCGGTGEATPGLLAEVQSSTGELAAPTESKEPTEPTPPEQRTAPDQPAVERTLVAARGEPDVVALAAPGGALAVVGVLGLLLLPFSSRRR